MTSAPTRAFLALDLGTTQAKAGLIALDGRLLALARAGYATTPDPAAPADAGTAEQDPAEWWSAMAVATRRALAEAGPVRVEAICADGHGPSFVAAGADGNPLGRSITWLDARGAAEAAELEAATGERGWPLGILPRALWFERERPALAAQARWYLASWEWIGLRLSGVASETTLPGFRHPDRDRLERTGLRVERIPTRHPASSAIGTLLPGPAADLGLAPGIPIVAGMADAYASFVGAGLLEPGDAIDTGGTSGGFAVYTDRPIEVPGAYLAAAPIPGRWLLGGAMNATGRALDWFREDILAGSVTMPALLEEAAAIAPGADGLVFLPYLAGERSPIWDPQARGTFVGLTLRHGRGHLARAILEAANLAIRHVAQPIVDAGIAVGELRVSGSMAREVAWNRVKADVTGFTVAMPEVVETAMLGSAITAACGAGFHASLADGARSMVRIERRFAPDPARAATYDALFSVYRDLYPALRPLFGRLAAIEAG